MHNAYQVHRDSCRSTVQPALVCFMLEFFFRVWTSSMRLSAFPLGQLTASALALALGLGFLGHVAAETPGLSATRTQNGDLLAMSRDQQLVTRQMALLIDRTHYLNKRLGTPETSCQVFDMYIDQLDPDHVLFLQSDVDQLRARYGATLGNSLLKGDLAPVQEIYRTYRQRIEQYFQFALAQVKRPLPLETRDTLNTDREKAPFFTSQAAQQDHWRKQLISQLITLTITQQEDQAKQAAIKANPSLAAGQELPPYSELPPMQTLQKRLNRQYQQLQRTKSDQVLEGILNATLAAYDPHSNYFAPVEAMEMNRLSTLQLEGIGVSIRSERGNEDYTRVETIVDGGPAAKSGQVRVGDRITGVAQDGQSMQDVVGWPSNEIVGLIRGKRGTRVTLRLQSASAGSQPRLVTLTRDVIQEEDAGVQSRVLTIPRDGKMYRMGVLDVPSFYFDYRTRRAGGSYRSVSNDVRDALQKLSQQKIDGLIVDLRNNPGGSLEEVSRMLGLFIKQGPVVQIRDSNGGINVYRDNDGGQQLYAGPMIVTVNLGSASASEIFSAAIQDYGRGLVVGSTTTGKGTAQLQIDSLAYGQATLTQRKFYRITGGSTQNKGVVPDIPMVSIYDEEEFGERKLKNPMQWDTISTAPYQREGNPTANLSTLSSRSQARQVADPQFIYLKSLRQIADLNKSRKVLPLSFNTRFAQLKEVEAMTLKAENQRRQATGLAPYANWESYQAASDAQSEQRGRMPASQRPKLPEDDVFMYESGNILIDQLQQATGRR